MCSSACARTSLIRLRGVRFQVPSVTTTGCHGNAPLSNCTRRQQLLTPACRQHMLTGVETTVQIAEGAASHDPDVGLRAVAALRTLTERLELVQVGNARKLGWSWQQIAERLGVSKQTVHRKYGRRIGRR
jgi:DNA-binding NarL/FixJ family response regulator